MIKSQLIMLEGLPSTGKTTNSRFIHIQLERNNIEAEWIHEVAMPHPVLFFEEVGMSLDEYDRFIKEYPYAANILNELAIFKKSTVGLHLPEIQWNYKGEIGEDVYKALLEYDAWKFPLEVYKKFALEKWTHFVERALENSEKVYIIDSAIFQFQIFTFLFKNRSYEELQGFIHQIEDIIRPLNPCLVYLHRENTEATINYLEKERGTEYLEYIWDRDKDQPYYVGRPLGAESFKHFLRDYSRLADLLFESFQTKKLTIDISKENWVCIEDKMLSFLGVKRKPSPNVVLQNGTYKNEELGYVINVDGLTIIDPTDKTRRIIPKSSNEFYVDWLPTVLKFEEDRIVIAGSQICAQWTKTGMIYDRLDII